MTSLPSGETQGAFFTLTFKASMSIIKPTIGRVVWFYPAGHPEGEQPLAAIVAHVWSDTCVNLAIFDPNGKAMEKPPTSILLVQPGNEVPSGGNYCTWMPYQIGQAKAA